MKTFLRLALVVASSVLGVAAAVYLAGPPGDADHQLGRAKLVAQVGFDAAGRNPAPVELPTAASPVDADRAPSRRLAQPLLDEPPLPQEEVCPSALCAEAPVRVATRRKSAVASQASDARQVAEELPLTPKPRAPRRDAGQSRSDAPTTGELLPSASPSASGGTAPAPDIMSGMINNLMQNPDQLRQLIQGTGLQDQTLGNLLNQLSGPKSAPASAAPAPASASGTSPCPANQYRSCRHAAPEDRRRVRPRSDG